MQRLSPARLAAIGPGTAEELPRRSISSRRSPRRKGCSPSCRARRPSPLRRRGRSPSFAQRRAWRRFRSALPDEGAAARRVPGGRPRRARLRIRGARLCSARSHGSGGLDRSADDRCRGRSRDRRGGGVARPRRPPRGGSSYRPSRRDHYLPHRLRLAGRLRRNLPRRDQAHHAGGGGHRHHARDPAQRVLQGALVFATRSRTCRSASTLP